MLLMGMWMSLTKKPMKPWKTRHQYLKHREIRLEITIMPKPIAVAIAILENSFLSGFVHLKPKMKMTITPEFSHLLISLMESLLNCFSGSKCC